MFLLIATALADCMAGNVLAQGDVLPPDGARIVIDLYGTTEKYGDLAALRPRLVRTDGQTVPLKAVARSNGGENQRQVVLQATSHLDTGTWHLQLDEAVEGFERHKGRILHGWDKPTAWTVAKPAAAPSWPKAPTLVEVEQEAFGCGPARYAVIDVGELPAGQWLEVELDAGTDHAQSALVPVDEGMARIGHGMCGGSFHMPSGSHSAKLSLVDSGGRRAPERHTIDFVVPDGF